MILNSLFGPTTAPLRRGESSGIGQVLSVLNGKIGLVKACHAAKRDL